MSVVVVVVCKTLEVVGIADSSVVAVKMVEGMVGTVAVTVAVASVVAGEVTGLVTGVVNVVSVVAGVVSVVAGVDAAELLPLAGATNLSALALLSF